MYIYALGETWTHETDFGRHADHLYQAAGDVVGIYHSLV